MFAGVIPSLIELLQRLLRWFKRFCGMAHMLIVVVYIRVCYYTKLLYSAD
jgi:hypothetical protein